MESKMIRLPCTTDAHHTAEFSIDDDGEVCVDLDSMDCPVFLSPESVQQLREWLQALKEF